MKKIVIGALVLAALGVGGFAAYRAGVFGKPSDSAPLPGTIIDSGIIPADSAPREGTKIIDFAAASSEKIASGLVVPDSAASVSVDSVPFLVPPVISIQAAGGDDSGTDYTVTKDGYSAAFKGEKYNMVVRGSNAVLIAPDNAPPPPIMPAAAPVSDDIEDFVFSEAENGAEATFTKYKASYTVSFECKKEGDSGCVTEAEARELVKNLIPAGN